MSTNRSLLLMLLDSTVKFHKRFKGDLPKFGLEKESIIAVISEEYREVQEHSFSNQDIPFDQDIIQTLTSMIDGSELLKELADLIVTCLGVVILEDINLKEYKDKVYRDVHFYLSNMCVDALGNPSPIALCLYIDEIAYRFVGWKFYNEEVPELIIQLIVIGDILAHYLNLDWAEVILSIADKNDSKTHETHVVSPTTGKITKRTKLSKKDLDILMHPQELIEDRFLVADSHVDVRFPSPTGKFYPLKTTGGEMNYTTITLDGGTFDIGIDFAKDEELED